jgi:hypothetical protein
MSLVWIAARPVMIRRADEFRSFLPPTFPPRSTSSEHDYDELLTDEGCHGAQYFTPSDEPRLGHVAADGLGVSLRPRAGRPDDGSLGEASEQSSERTTEAPLQPPAGAFCTCAQR